MRKHFFSIITPTYNRAERLIKAFNSLCAQTFKDFQWIIVDDGSTDETDQVIAGFIQKANFDIVYHKISHGGKHMATRAAYEIASGKWVFELDSDDELYDSNTLNNLYGLIDTLPKNCNCIGGCFIDQHNNIFPEIHGDYIDYDINSYVDTFCNSQHLLNIAWLMKMDYARSVLPPAIQDNLTYFPEGVINIRRALKATGFHLRIFNQPWYRYNMYNSDSVSVHTNKTNAYWYYAKSLLETFHEYNLLYKYPEFIKHLSKSLINETPSDRSVFVNYTTFKQIGRPGFFYKLLLRLFCKRLLSISHNEIWVLGIKINKS